MRSIRHAARSAAIRARAGLRAARRSRYWPLKAMHAQHLRHVEQRLHAAESTVSRLEELGLIQALSDHPETYARWLTWRPPGHFYSAIPSLPEIEARADKIWGDSYPKTLPGIDLRDEAQLELFAQIAETVRDLDLPSKPQGTGRYYTDNVAYGTGDALILNGILRHVRPRRLIEIGSGFSSAMTLDTVERYLGSNTELTFVEPYPELLESLLAEGDSAHVSVVAKGAQDTPLELFDTLQSGDVLFIDSTHVVKTGSDVVWIYSQILPRLAAGVWVHIHDIFYPFEYPREWVLEGRTWSEAYLVRAFLTNNPDFEIALFSSWLSYFHLDTIAAQLPAMLQNTGGALWLRRVAKTRT